MPVGRSAFYTLVLAKITGFAAWIAALTVAIFAATWLLGTDLGAWLFEQVLDITISVLNTISFDAELFNPAEYIGSLPAETVQMLGLLRVGESLAIVASAVVLKVLLQLIPFTRLGS